ncbi:MAG: type IV toxin-antitoxin system AbiEi family antitoxin [Gemmatimonadota bacterium]
MLKTTNTLGDAELASEAAEALRAALGRAPFIQLKGLERDVRLGDRRGSRADILVRLRVAGQSWRLVAEVKREGHPKQVRMAALQLNDIMSRLPGSAVYGVVLAPFISERSADACREAGVGYVDLAGNCRIAFDHVFLETRGAENPRRTRRDLRSLFTPKAGRVLRVLLDGPARPWKVAELSAVARVSFGHVSNVRKRLVEEEWAAADRAGLRLTRPDDLLHAWGRAYRPSLRARETLYTALHGERLDAAVRAALGEAGMGLHLVVASFSAARWLAPYARQATTFFYADAVGREVAHRHLQLEPAARGENVVIEEPEEDDVFVARLEPAPGIWCSGAVQTWLDLSASGERGREAADHLLRERLLPAWRTSP